MYTKNDNTAGVWGFNLGALGLMKIHVWLDIWWVECYDFNIFNVNIKQSRQMLFASSSSSKDIENSLVKSLSQVESMF